MRNLHRKSCIIDFHRRAHAGNRYFAHVTGVKTPVTTESKTNSGGIRSTHFRVNAGYQALQTVSISQGDEKAAIYSDMNCRRFAVFAVFTGVLVHTGDDAKAAGPTYRQATATATILPSATAKSEADGRGEEKQHRSAGSQPITTRYIDRDGFLTTAANPHARVIHIVDLP